MIVQLQLPGGLVAVELVPGEPRVGQVVHHPTNGRRFRAVEGERPMQMVDVRGQGRVYATVVPVEEVPAVAAGNSSRRAPQFSGGAGRMQAVRG